LRKRRNFINSDKGDKADTTYFSCDLFLQVGKTN